MRVEPSRLWRRVIGRRRVAALVSLGFVGVAVFVATMIPAMAPADALPHDLDNRLQVPSVNHPMGTDAFGRDVLLRVLHGTRESLTVAVAAVALSAALGVVLGAASGYLGGIVDLLAQRLVDALSAFPPMVIALVFIAALGSSRVTVVMALVLAMTPLIVRVARARCLEVKKEAYLVAARALGSSHPRIIARHVLPQVVPTVLVLATGFLGRALTLEAALSFMGLGVPPPAPSLGLMIHEGARNFLETAPWLTIFPGLTLSLVALSFALLGDVARDALDPHLRHL